MQTATRPERNPDLELARCERSRAEGERLPNIKRMVLSDLARQTASASSPNPTSGAGPSTIYDVAIVGAGIIGLATALELRAAGLSVVVFDRQLAMHEASWAAGGMLAADDPGNPEAIHELSVYSRSLYPEFLIRIQQLTGRSVALRTERTLEGLPMDGPEHRTPSNASPCTVAELEEAAPGLTSAPLAQGLRFVSLEEQSLDPCDLTEVLPVAVRAAGIELHEHTPVLRVERAQALSQIFYTRTAEAAKQADSPCTERSILSHHVLFATGAWLAPIAQPPAIVPCKGNMLRLELDGPVQTRCVLRIPGLYLIPRGQNTRGKVEYVVGATLERVGFDQTPSETLLANLADRAAALWPPLAQAKRIDGWAGLRPESPDGLPVIGAFSTADRAHKNLWMATGHFRNGILQAPGTARLLCDLITGKRRAIPLEQFCCDRFLASTI